ncbi:hypothetical protein F511_40663 [Dorcoceras hygrometricum]|uniref:Uncharacterized protein n=1 Tax=Dorcoceras hygrometricum TaxID=472368 RepID=A0A2Z7ABC3_9LAMI|nr:hypothetical protein F511_40663 [Dorcoceras hygrometricum]
MMTSLLMSSTLSAPADLYLSSSNLRLFSASVPAGPFAPADLSSSAEHDVVTNDIIIDGPFRCSSWFPLMFQLVHFPLLALAAAVGVFEKSADGMRSADELFEIFSRYILHTFLKRNQQLLKYIRWRMRNDSVWISRSDIVWISWNDSVLIGLFISADGYSNFNQQSKHLDNDDEDSAGYQSYFRRKLKVIQIRSFAHKEKICTIVQLPGIKETS